MSAGDYFCCMQGAWDKRKNKEALRPEHQCDNYLDSLVTTGADFIQKTGTAKQWICIATGNHEAAIQNKHETNLIDRLCGVLNDRTGSRIHNGGYSGFIIFKFRCDTTGGGYAITLRYAHGAGGGVEGLAEMTKIATFTPDADIIMTGHTHGSFIREMQRQRLDTRNGTLTHDTQVHIKCPSYKDEYGDGYKGWAVEKGFGPRPKGAWWLRFFYEKESKAYPRRIRFDIHRAS